MAERQANRQDKSVAPAPTDKSAADLSARQSYQPVYIAPRRSAYESEARRAARTFGGAPIDFQPTPLGGGGSRAELGPDLSRKLTREVDKGGTALPTRTRRQMERHLHEGLGGVTIVSNAVSDEVAQAVEADAFTVHNTVFFRSGVYAPGDPRSDRILAHELMHALQHERGGSDDYVIQRNDPNEQEPGDVWEGGRGNTHFALTFAPGSNTPTLMSIKELKLPKINNKIKGKTAIRGISDEHLITDLFDYTTRGGDRDTVQRTKWEEAFNEDTTAVENFINNLPANPDSENDSDPFYYIKVIASNQIISGTKDQILARQEMMIPTWDKSGTPSFFDLDHYREHQLQGRDEIENIWLLESSVNRSAGSKIRNKVLAEINDLYKRARDANFFTGRNEARDVARYPRTPPSQALHFHTVSGGESLGRSVDTWTIDEIKAAKHLKNGQTELVRALSLDELRELGLVPGPNGAPTTVLWFLGERSSFYRRIDISDLASPKYDGAPIAGGDLGAFIKNFKIDTVTLTANFDPANAERGAEMGRIVGSVKGGVGTYYDRDLKDKVRAERIEVTADITLPLRYDPRYGYGSYIDRSGVREALMNAREAKAKGASPFEVNEAGLTDDWAMGFSATLTSTHPMFSGLQATLGLTSYGVQLDVDIPTDRLDFGFFRVTEANLSVAYGDEGLLFGGAAAFEIPSIGNGQIVAMGETIEGSFDFDFDFVDPASISVKYENENWSFEAELGITEGVVPGLQSGQIRIGMDEEGGLSFDGEAAVLLPGQSEPVEIEILYSEEEGVTIGGTVDFNTDSWPMVEGATVTVSANYDPDAGAWTLSGTGSASFAFPGVTGTLSATYNNGGIVFSGDGDVAIGNATGEFSFAVGNFPLNDEGEFDTSAEPTEEFDAFGSGSVSISFGPYLTGTAGIAYTPENEIEISGGIALPPSIELFEAREYDKNIIRFPRLEFPIFGVTIPVVGSIGVFGFIGGSLRGFATIGPATLDDTQVDIAYTIGDPDSAVIHGESHLNFGMEAGLELALSGGLGLGAAVADLSGEVGITAALILNVDAGADLDVHWTPLTGLAIDMALRGSASPSFRVGVFGRVAASVAIFGEVWSERWDRTLAEFGSGLEVGVVQPAGWDEENGLDLDFANAVFTYPEFDIEEISSDIMDRIV